MCNTSFDLPNTIVKGKRADTIISYFTDKLTKLRKVEEFAFSYKTSFRAEIWIRVLSQHYCSFNRHCLNENDLYSTQKDQLFQTESLDQRKLGEKNRKDKFFKPTPEASKQ